MQRSSVDLPDPDGPITATTEPLGTSSDMPLSTCTGPNAFQRSLTSIIAGASRIVSIRSLQAVLDPLGEEGEGKEDGEVDHRHGRIGFERPVGRRGDQLALIEQVGDGNGRDQGGVLELDDRLIEEGRYHALDRLRQDHPSQDLDMPHADCSRRIPLTALDRDHAAAEDLRKNAPVYSDSTSIPAATAGISTPTSTGNA